MGTLWDPPPPPTLFQGRRDESSVAVPGAFLHMGEDAEGHSHILAAPMESRCPQRGGGVPFGAHRLGTPLADPLVPQDVATLQFCANKLDKKDFFGKSDPFMVFYRSNEDGT